VRAFKVKISLNSSLTYKNSILICAHLNFFLLLVKDKIVNQWVRLNDVIRVLMTLVTVQTRDQFYI